MNNHILVIDNDETLLEYYRVIFSHTKNTDSNQSNLTFNTTFVDHGLAAIEQVKQLQKQNKNFAVAFIDVNMPPGINGIETAKRIRKIDPEIHVVFVTADSDQDIDNINDILDDNVIFLKKPFSRDEIFQLARTLCAAWNNKALSHNLPQGTSAKLASSLTEPLSQMLANVSEIQKSNQQLEVLAKGFSQILLELNPGKKGEYILKEQFFHAMESGISHLNELSSEQFSKSASGLTLQLRAMSNQIHQGE